MGMGFFHLFWYLLIPFFTYGMESLNSNHILNHGILKMLKEKKGTGKTTTYEGLVLRRLLGVQGMQTYPDESKDCF